MATPDLTPLSCAQRSKIRRLSAPREAQAGEEAGELNIVPYPDIIMNIMMFVLASVVVAFTATINTSAAYAGPERPAPHDGPAALRLTALITHQGIVLTTASGAIAPGCSDLGAGVTLPNKGGAYDLAGLSACARRIKGVRPEYALESQVSLSANPDVPYETLVSVMDALRSDDTGELFPEVQLGVVR
jgi:biopolymer transport protein TolR